MLQVNYDNIVVPIKEIIMNEGINLNIGPTVAGEVVDPASQRKYHSENAQVGVELNSYIKKTPSDDGTYVLIVSHHEHIEKIRQPLTPEEIEAKKAEERFMAKVVGAVVLGGISLMAFASIVESRSHKKTVVEHHSQLD